MDTPWQVTKQSQTIALDPDTDTYGPVMQVTFRTRAGDVASINVPITRYNANNVKARIDEMVAHLNEVRGIGPDVQ